METISTKMVYAAKLRESVAILQRGLNAAEAGMRVEEVREEGQLKQAIKNAVQKHRSSALLDDKVQEVYDIHAIDFMDLEAMFIEVRKSMMVALYHTWERIAREITGKHGTRDNHEKLVCALREHGIELDPRIEHLRLLANLIKHSSKDKAEKLHAARPDLLYHNFDADIHFPNDWASTVRLSQEQTAEFFAVVAEPFQS